ncbi:CaiB/BaiF CoA transferase family protein [Gottfriedia acidiceleris]|uniref:CaiB/BaiF CoA transferase family protein n=1 Tax=Gottfriedia acidiceleris TaxID=371036 RepID=UPI003D20098B
MTLLKGLKILDFSALLPGPFATMMMADLGAEVLRVEPPSRRNQVKRNAIASLRPDYLNRSKKALALDLKKPESVEVVKELVKEYDIVFEQFRPGVMDRLGVGYEALKEVNPKVIYCSLTGFGQTGPYRNRPGHDNNYLSIAGLASYSGRKSVGPTLSGTQIADLAGGSLHSIIGLLSAVIYRDRTGKGQWLDISMTDCTFALNAYSAPGYLAGGVNPELEETLLNGGLFYDYYETKDGRYFSVGSAEPEFRKLLCEAIGRGDLFDLSLSLFQDEIRTFKKIVKEAFLTKTFSEWKEIFEGIEACVEPVLSLAEACEHPQLVERKMVVEVPKLDGGYQKQIACPIKSNEFTPEYKHVGLELGKNTEEIMQSLDLPAEVLNSNKD